MAGSNVLLALALIVLTVGLMRQYRTGAVGRPCTFYWGLMFLGLFVVMPLASNLLYGPARSLHWWKQEWITARDPYLIYGFSTLALSLAYCLASVRWAGLGGARDAGLPPAEQRRARADVGARERHRLILTGFATVAGVALYVYGTGLSLTQLLVGGRFIYYEQATVRGPVLGLGLYTSSLIAYFAYVDAKLKFPHRVLSLVVYGAIALMLVASGGRKWLLFAGSGLLAGFYDRRGGIQLSAGGVIMFVGLGAVVVLWQAIRAMGVFEVGVEELSRLVTGERIISLLWEEDATHFYRASLEAIRVNVQQDLLYPFAVVRRLVLLPIPNEWTFGLKPQGIPFLFADYLHNRTAARGGNLPPGFIGNLVLSFGWRTALLVGPAVTLFALKGADWMVRKRDGWVRNTVFAYFVATALLLMRGSEGGIYFLIFGVLAVGMIELVLRTLQPLWMVSTRAHNPGIPGSLDG